MTPLDQAHAAMLAGAEAEARHFYHLLADAPLFVLLEAEAEGDDIRPQVFDLDDGPVLLAFDTEDRLAGFGTGPVPYATLPGRILAQQLSGQGLSLGLNLGTGAASETLLPPENLAYLTEMLDVTPQPAEARPIGFAAPSVPAALDQSLRHALTGASGLAAGAVLAAVRYDGGGQGHLLAIVDAAEPARTALARAVAEALAFAGLDAAALDVTFLSGDDPALLPMARCGRLYDIPAPEIRQAAAPAAPGTDPARPPKLR